MTDGGRKPGSRGQCSTLKKEREETMKHKNLTFYYDSQTDDRRAKIHDMPGLRRSRLVIRDDRGQGKLLLCKIYTTHKGARRALSRLGSKWVCFKKNIY